MPEHAKEKQQNQDLINVYLKKLQEYDSPINLDQTDKNSFINTYRQNYMDNIAQVQQHFPININSSSTIQFFTYQKLLQKKKPAKK